MNTLEHRGVTYFVLETWNNSCRHGELLCAFHSQTHCKLEHVNVDCKHRVFLDDTPQNRAAFVLHKMEGAPP